MTYTKPTEPSFEPSAESLRGNFRGGSLALSPPWLGGDVGARLMYTQGIQLDGLGEYLRMGVLQRMPELAQPEMLPALGKDKKIFRGLSESDDNYATRLTQFKATWKLAGNAPTLLRQLWELQKPNAVRMRYVVNGYTGTNASELNQFADWWTIDDSGLSYERVSPSNWNWDGSFGKNVRFWIIIYRADLTPAKWGIPPYYWADPGLGWGAEPASDRSWVIDTFNIVQTFKAAGSHMGPYPGFQGGLIVADPDFTSAPWGPDGPFSPSYAPGYPMPNGTFSAYGARPPGAIYISGL